MCHLSAPHDPTKCSWGGVFVASNRALRRGRAAFFMTQMHPLHLKISSRPKKLQRFRNVRLSSARRSLPRAEEISLRTNEAYFPDCRNAGITLVSRTTLFDPSLSVSRAVPPVQATTSLACAVARRVALTLSVGVSGVAE